MKVTVETKEGARTFACEPGENILYAGLRSGAELPYELSILVPTASGDTLFKNGFD